MHHFQGYISILGCFEVGIPNNTSHVKLSNSGTYCTSKRVSLVKQVNAWALICKLTLLQLRAVRQYTNNILKPTSVIESIFDQIFDC